jgi:hypothetical protein
LAASITNRYGATRFTEGVSVGGVWRTTWPTGGTGSSGEYVAASGLLTESRAGGTNTLGLTDSIVSNSVAGSGYALQSWVTAQGYATQVSFDAFTNTYWLAYIGTTNRLAVLEGGTTTWNTVTSKLVATDTNGFVKADVTNGLATASITNGLASTAITNGLGTLTLINGGTTGTTGVIAQVSDTATITFPAPAAGGNASTNVEQTWTALQTFAPGMVSNVNPTTSMVPVNNQLITATTWTNIFLTVDSSGIGIGSTNNSGWLSLRSGMYHFDFTVSGSLTGTGTDALALRVTTNGVVVITLVETDASGAGQYLVHSASLDLWVSSNTTVNPQLFLRGTNINAAATRMTVFPLP